MADSLADEIERLTRERDTAREARSVNASGYLAEIERLTRERDAFAALSRGNVLAAVKDRNELVAENERLRRELAEAAEGRSHYAEECDRLAKELAEARVRIEELEEELDVGESEA